ncbi:hypothetical protein [Pandoraea eparura]|uniref:hypothetical protein n=1 Tax=Pandoraea eparura TaxID=2508291 RepID=UPI0012418423|nr:hypothetical protein [Pandoraea eparura]
MTASLIDAAPMRGHDAGAEPRQSHYQAVMKPRSHEATKTPQRSRKSTKKGQKQDRQLKPPQRTRRVFAKIRVFVPANEPPPGARRLQGIALAQFVRFVCHA